MRTLNRIFLNFLMAYIALILIPLVAGVIVNSAVVSEYEQSVKRSHLTHLKKTQDVLESFTEDIKWSTYQLAGNTKLLRLIADRDKKLSDLERSSLIRETMIELNNSLLYNTSFNSIFYIYLKDQDIIITPYSIYKHSDFNDSVNFFKMDSISSPLWHDMLGSQFFNGKILPVRTVIIEDFKNKRMIPYVQTLPVDSAQSSGGIDGAIVYLIGEADFIRFLDYEEMPEGSVSYIADDQNNLITLVSKSDGDFTPLELEGEEGMIERTIDGRKMFIIYTTGRKNNWKYVSVLPEEWVVKTVSFFQLFSIGLLLVALVICFIAAYSLSQRWSEPIISSYRSISGYLNKDNREKVSFMSLKSNINELIHYSEDMHDELLNQQVFVHNAFVNRLINGFFRSSRNLEDYLKHLGFSITEDHFSVAVISQGDIDSAGTTESFDEMVRIKNLLKLRLQQDFPLKIMISEQGNSNLVLVVMTSSTDIVSHESQILKSFRDFSSDLPLMLKEDLLIALGGTVESLMKVHHSYMEAQDVLSYSGEADGLSIVHLNDMEKKMEDFYYPLEMESRLINTAKAGNLENLSSIIDSLYGENMENRLLERSTMKQFLSGLSNTVHRILNQIPDAIREELSINMDENGSDADFESIRINLQEICAAQNRHKKSHNVSLIDKVKEYLAKNYSNRNLSLFMVAEHFSISESYLSFFFKEQTGTNFSTYLEKLRIDEAKELLINSDEPIHIIAGKVGYNSDKTFRRVFQKIFNISPGKFREEL